MRSSSSDREVEKAPKENKWVRAAKFLHAPNFVVHLLDQSGAEKKVCRQARKKKRKIR